MSIDLTKRGEFQQPTSPIEKASNRKRDTSKKQAKKWKKKNQIF